MIEQTLTRTYMSRWVTLSASCFIQLSSGLSYTFSVISPTLKERFQFRETEIAAIGSAFNLGGYLALPSGYACDSLVNYKRYGPKIIVCTGCILLFLGYFGIYACAVGLMAPTFWRVFAFAILAGNSSTWMDTEMLITNVRNFPSDRGSVVGILKAFLGLSASVYSSIYLALFSPNTIAFLLFVSIGPPIATAALSVLVNKVPEEFFDEHHPQTLQKAQGSPSHLNSSMPSPPGGDVENKPALSSMQVETQNDFRLSVEKNKPSLSPQQPPNNFSDAADDDDSFAAENKKKRSSDGYFLIPRNAAGYSAVATDDAANSLQECAGGSIQSLPSGAFPPRRPSLLRRLTFFSTGRGTSSCVDPSADATAAAAQAAAAAAACAWPKKQRFLAIYAVATTIALYQLSVSVYSTFRTTDQAFRREMATGLFIVLSVLMIVPFSAGAYVHRRRKVKLLARRPVPWSLARSRSRLDELVDDEEDEKAKERGGVVGDRSKVRGEEETEEGGEEEEGDEEERKEEAEDGEKQEEEEKLEEIEDEDEDEDEEEERRWADRNNARGVKKSRRGIGRRRRKSTQGKNNTGMLRWLSGIWKWSTVSSAKGAAADEEQGHATERTKLLAGAVDSEVASSFEASRNGTGRVLTDDVKESKELLNFRSDGRAQSKSGSHGRAVAVAALSRAQTHGSDAVSVRPSSEPSLSFATMALEGDGLYGKQGKKAFGMDEGEGNEGEGDEGDPTGGVVAVVAPMDDDDAEALPICVSAAAAMVMTGTAPDATSTAAALLEVGEAEDVEDGGAALLNLSPARAARTVAFWLLLLQFGVGSGTSLAFINNLGSIVLSLGGEHGSQIALVSLFSVANAAGRILTGALSERLLNRHRVPRPALLAAASVSLLLGVLGCTAARLGDLYVLSVVIGMAFGAHWCLIPAISSDLFGLKYFGTNYSLLQIGPALGSYLLATLLMGYEYEAATARQGGGIDCMGRDCYRTSWLVLSLLNASAVTCTLSLIVVTRKEYRRLSRAARRAERAAKRAAELAIDAERRVIARERMEQPTVGRTVVREEEATAVTSS